MFVDRGGYFNDSIVQSVAFGHKQLILRIEMVLQSSLLRRTLNYINF